MTIEPRTPTQPEKLKRRSAAAGSAGSTCRAWAFRSAHRASAPSSPPLTPVLRHRTGPRPAGRSTGRRPVINPASILFSRKNTIQYRSARHLIPPLLAPLPSSPRRSIVPPSSILNLHLRRTDKHNGPVQQCRLHSVASLSAGKSARTRVGRMCSATTINTGKRALSPGTSEVPGTLVRIEEGL